MTREEILAANDIRVEPVEVPGWGTVYVRTLSALDRGRLEARMRSGSDSEFANVRARFAIALVCDDKGNRLFTDKDVELLGQKSAVALDEIMDAGMRLNAMREEDIQELEKNFESVPSGNSSSG